MRTLQLVDSKLDALQEQVDLEESEGTHYRMRHIKTLPEKKSYKMVGTPGLKLRVCFNLYTIHWIGFPLYLANSN